MWSSLPTGCIHEVISKAEGTEQSSGENNNGIGVMEEGDAIGKCLDDKGPGKSEHGFQNRNIHNWLDNFHICA